MTETTFQRFHSNRSRISDSQVTILKASGKGLQGRVADDDQGLNGGFSNLAVRIRKQGDQWFHSSRIC